MRGSTYIENYNGKKVKLSSDLEVGGNIIANSNSHGSSSTHGYGNSNWNNTTRTANCPNGSFVTGITVAYGGTCSNQCDRDAGIIREIKLRCSKL
jgi:hypothetical protein